jgi:HAE1 family hydrophobic/amphiphilic exporter-1
MSLILMFLGGLAIATLPVSQFPSVAPPLVQVSIAYPGASAKVLEDSVLIPLERSINGVQGMKYMISDATSAGEATIQVVFHQGTDPNAAVGERAEPGQPGEDPAAAAGAARGDHRQPHPAADADVREPVQHRRDADMKFLFNFAGVNMIPELQRIRGVARRRFSAAASTPCACG